MHSTVNCHILYFPNSNQILKSTFHRKGYIAKIVFNETLGVSSRDVPFRELYVSFRDPRVANRKKDSLFLFVALIFLHLPIHHSIQFQLH